VKAITVSLYANYPFPHLISLRIQGGVTVTSEQRISVKKLTSFGWHLLTVDATHAKQFTNTT
jgi:hypothetical protein